MPTFARPDELSSMKCIRFDVCKEASELDWGTGMRSSMKCIRFDVCKLFGGKGVEYSRHLLNEVHTF